MGAYKTPKREVAVILIPAEISAKMQILVGNPKQVSNLPTTVFNSDRIEFIAELSKRLLAYEKSRAFPDIVSYAYWSRKSNLKRLAVNYSTANQLRVGVGLSFHICPANVPVNFAFSMAFGLLSGNTCVIRLPTKSSPTIEIIVKIIIDLLSESAYSALKDELMLVRFDRNDQLSRFWMSVADGRIVWGGDSTVEYMRAMPSKPRSREVAFPDRYSFSVMNPAEVLALNEKGLQDLCLNIFNDIYLMDQAACSSPQLVVWIGEPDVVAKAKVRLWPAVERLAKLRYSPKPIQIMDKYVQACQLALHNDQVITIEHQNNQLYRVELSDVSSHQDQCRGYFGTVHEVTFSELESLARIINDRYQTVTYFGLDLEKFREFMINNRLRGIDRVVPIGKALDMDINWDGYEIASALSRNIVIN
jgi:hypothetical protein